MGIHVFFFSLNRWLGGLSKITALYKYLHLLFLWLGFGCADGSVLRFFGPRRGGPREGKMRRGMETVDSNESCG